MAHPFTIDRVLFATDLSPASEAALLCATSLARRFNAELYLLHVVAAPVGGTDGGEQEAAMVMRQLRQELLGTHDIYATTAILSGEPATRILQKAADVHADVIVMGTSVRCPQPGGLTDTVLRSASCPVLAVPPIHQEGTELRQ